MAGLDAQGFAEAESLAVDGGEAVFGVHGAIAGAGHFAVPVVEGEEEFLVVAGGVFFGFDEEKTVLAGVLGFFEVFAGEGVGVVPAESCGSWGEGVTRVAAGGDHRCAFFHGSVHVRRQKEAVPVDDFFIFGAVGDVDGDWLAFP